MDRLGANAFSGLNLRKFGAFFPDLLQVGGGSLSQEAAHHGWMVLPKVNETFVAQELRLRAPTLLVASRSSRFAPEWIEIQKKNAAHFVLRVSSEIEENIGWRLRFGRDVWSVRACSCSKGSSEHGLAIWLVSSPEFAAALRGHCSTSR